jgi:hypothetical protein
MGRMGRRGAWTSGASGTARRPRGSAPRVGITGAGGFLDGALHRVEEAAGRSGQQRSGLQGVLLDWPPCVDRLPAVAMRVKSASGLSPAWPLSYICMP